MANHITHLLKASVTQLDNILVTGGSSASVSAAAWSFLGTNNKEIASLCAILGAACAIWGVIRKGGGEAKHDRPDKPDS